MKIKNIINNIIEYLFIILTTLSFISVYYRSPNYSVHYFINILWEFILFYLFILSFRKLSYPKLRKYVNFSVIFFLVVSVCLILYYVYFPFSYPLYDILLYLINPILLIPIFLENDYYFNNNLMIKFENFIIILSIISLIFWVFYALGINTNDSLTVGYRDLVQIPSYFNIDFFPQNNISFLGINNLPRNSSIFFEPSMYSYILCIAFLIELYIKHRNNNIVNFKMVLLFMAILSTTSTTGIMIAGPALLIYLIFNLHNKSLKTILLLSIPISFIFFKFVMLDKASNNIETSYGIRMNDLYATFMTWKQHLIIGNGIGNDNEISKYMYPFRLYTKNAGSAAGIPNTLAYGGIIFSSFYILPNILSLKCNRNIALFSLFILILNIFTNVIMAYICIFILSYLWACILLPKKCKMK